MGKYEKNLQFWDSAIDIKPLSPEVLVLGEEQGVVWVKGARAGTSTAVRHVVACCCMC